jgi:GAF domain-containing protein
MSKTEFYRRVVKDTRALMADERDPVANAANVTAVLYHELPSVNWAGFYFLRRHELVLGPFQGKPACVRIPLGKGVCGTAAQKGLTVLVPNVHEFPGHIACDAASRSEIVVPLVQDGRLVGVLDLDSPELGRFDDEDRRGLEEVASVFCQWSDPLCES